MQATTEQKLPFILLIDDTPEDVYINNRMIEKHGKFRKIMKFSMGGDALQYLEANLANPENLPDIIFVDIHMPLMNGFEFATAFGKLPAPLQSTCKLFLVSSSFDSRDVAQAKVHPFITDFFEKPLAKNIIEEVINRVEAGC